MTVFWMTQTIGLLINIINFYHFTKLFCLKYDIASLVLLLQDADNRYN